MQCSRPRGVLCRTAVALAMLAVLQGCGREPPIAPVTPIAPTTSWNSPRMKTIKKEWDTLSDVGEHARGKEAEEKYGSKNEKLYDMLDEILARNLSDDDLRSLLGTCETLPDRAGARSDFDNWVLKYMARKYIETGDREALLKLLTTRFPDKVYFETPIEFAMVMYRKRVGDPISLLGEAYSKCRNKETRRHLAVIMRRAFVDSGVKGKDDDEFVNNAVQWYEKEKNHLTHTGNWYFRRFSYDDMPDFYKKNANAPWTGVRPNPLFVEKSDKRK
jgi:hypothetical protein